MSPERRILFLDDDPRRGIEFLTFNPGALWVETAAECLERLSEPWDEVHLDHDLGGEQFVGHEREDCGMAVVRWLCAEPRPHLRETFFFLHTHNPGAALTMAFHLQTMGYRVQERPFGSPPTGPGAPGTGLWSRLRALLWRRERRGASTFPR